MVTVNQIREVAYGYIQRGDIQEFLLEFSKLSFNIHQHGELEAIELAKRIEDKLAKVHAHPISQDEFRDWLRELLPIAVSLSQEVPQSTGSTAQVIVTELTITRWEMYPSLPDVNRVICIPIPS